MFGVRGSLVCFRYCHQSFFEKKLLRQLHPRLTFNNLSCFSSCSRTSRTVRVFQPALFPNSVAKFRISHVRTLNDFTKFYRSSNQKSKDALLYTISFLIFMVGLTFLSVPLYRVFCQVAGLGGDPRYSQDKSDKVLRLKPRRDRIITVHFSADVSPRLPWEFKPEQNIIKIVPGETSLAFYTAKNLTSTPITGVSTYSIVPFQAALYFNKIQCFCFEEQRLNPGEEIDMPVFFYIDPEFLEDPALENEDDITLSYTFFESRGGIQLPSLLSSLQSRTGSNSNSETVPS